MTREVASAVRKFEQSLAAAQQDAHRSFEPSTLGAGSNWLWLAEIARWHASLELDLDGPHLGPDLQRHFDDVQFHIVRPRARLPFGNLAFDCVTLNGVAERLAGHRTRAAAAVLGPIFRECRRVLRPGGCLYVGTGPLDVQRGKSRWSSLLGAARPLVVDRLLGDAGFSTVHAYWADPCLERPFVIIPATHRALMARERTIEKSAGPDYRRLMAIRLGLPHVLYPARITLAYV